MKFFKKLLMVIFLPIIFLYIALFVFVHVKAKDMAVEQLELMLDRDVSINSIDLMPLVGLRVRGLEIADLVSFSDFQVKLDILKTIKYGLGIKTIKIDDLNVELGTDSEGDFFFPYEVAPASDKSIDMPDTKLVKDLADKVASKKDDKQDEAEEPMIKSQKEFAVYLGKLILNDANIVYNNKSKQVDGELQIPIDKLKLKYFSFPMNTKSRFELSASVKLANKLIDDCISLKGWLDWPKRNMNADLEVREFPFKAVDVFLPAKYNGQMLGIDDALIDLVANASAKDNELTITALLKLPEYHYIQQPKDSARALVVRSVIESLKKQTGVPEYELKLTTKLDKPQVDTNQLKASVFKDKGRVTVDLGTTMVEQITGKKTSDLVEQLDPQEKAAVGAAGAILDSVLGTKADGEEQGVISGLLDAYTVVKDDTSLETNTTQSVPVAVENENIDYEDQLEDAAIEVGVSLLKGLFD